MRKLSDVAVDLLLVGRSGVVVRRFDVGGGGGGGGGKGGVE